MFCSRGANAMAKRSGVSNGCGEMCVVSGSGFRADVVQGGRTGEFWVEVAEVETDIEVWIGPRRPTRQAALHDALAAATEIRAAIQGAAGGNGKR
jgi:hypothetical protein